MAEFQEIVESIRQEEADVRKLFGGDGEKPVRGRSNPQYMAKLAEAAMFVSDVMTGRRPVRQLQEAMSTSDFPLLFGDVLDRQMLASYRETPSVWRSFCRSKTVPDFRDVKRRYLDGGDGTLPAVAELGEYTQVTRSEGEYTYAVSKYGAAFDLSWETLINDDLDQLRDQPVRFGRAARRSEDKFATSLIAGASGPDATLFSLAHDNLETAALSVAGLTTLLSAFTGQTDAGGEPILSADRLTLMIPPALEVTALNIANALTLRYEGDGTVLDTFETANWLKNRISVVVNPYLPIVDTTHGDTAYYLFADPNMDRGVVEMGFLRGHEEPEIFMKAPDAQRVGGGLDAMAGDFYHDAILYKVRHVMGGGLLDYKGAAASHGGA
jgi:hypothetical protein